MKKWFKLLYEGLGYDAGQIWQIYSVRLMKMKVYFLGFNKNISLNTTLLQLQLFITL